MGYSWRATPARGRQHDIVMPPTSGKIPSRLEPLDFIYQHGQELPNGAHFMVLPTLKALESHWSRIRHQMPFAAQGNCPGDRPLYLRPHEWVFAPTRPKLVEAVIRWNEIGIQPVWYDWKREKPDEYSYYFRERESSRLYRISNGSWSKKDEARYLISAARKNPGNFTGWWRLANLPFDQTHESWFSGLLDEPFDPGKPIEEVNSIFQYQTFVDWNYQCLDEVIFFDSVEMEEELGDLHNQHKLGRDRG